MKAIVQARSGSPDFLELQEIEKPALADDRVLVKVRAASVNAMDWHLLQPLPRIIGKLLRMEGSRVPGRDLAGHVEAVGRNVTRLRPGDEVFGVGLGSFAEYTAATEEQLAPKPGNLSFEQAAAIPIAGCTALQGLRDKGGVQAGQRVLIHGAGGGVGTFAVQIARALGAHVTAVSTTRNLELLGSIGADEVVDYTKVDFTTRGQRYDVVFDLGANRSFSEHRRALGPNGKLVLCGAPKGLLAQMGSLLAAMRKPRPGSQRIAYVASVHHQDLVALKDLAEAGKLTPVIDRELPLTGVPEAIRYVGTGQARGKVVIRIA